MFRKSFVALLLAVFAAGTIFTTDAEAKPGKGQGKGEKLKEAIDTNHDGKISKEELEKFLQDHPKLKAKLQEKKKKN